MLVQNKRAFFKGIILMITFLVVLFLMFTPLFKGKNALEAADELFNSISKGSTSYIGDLKKQAEAYKGAEINVNLQVKKPEQAEKMKKVLGASGAKVTAEGEKLTASGDLGAILAVALSDSEAMFANREEPLRQKYDMPGKEAMYIWWSALKETDKDLSRQKSFKQAAFVSEVIKKGVEVGYNFFGIEKQTAASKAGLITFAMIFYVIYTLWWGVAILFLFEGVGFQLKAKAKKEF